MRYLRQSTSVDLPIGPFVDQADGVTAETGLTITQADVRLKKNAGNWAQKAAAQTLTHEENGYYEVTLDATDTDTIGHLRLNVSESGALPVWEDFAVLDEAVYDVLFGTTAPATTGNLTASTLGTVTNLTNLPTIPNNWITAAGINADAITAAKIADGAITAAKIAADAITDAKVAADVTVASVTGSVGSVTGNVGGNVTGSVGSVASGGITAGSFAAGAIDAAAIAADAIGSSELAASAVTEIQSGLSTLDAAGVRAAVGLASANLDVQLQAIDDYLDTEIAAIKAVTDQFTAAQAEPSAVPAANASPLAKIAWLALLARNRLTQTATTQTAYADNGSTVVGTSAHSDSGTEHVKGEWS